MVRHANPEMTVMKKESFILRSLETRGTAAAPHEEAARGRRAWARPFLWLPCEGIGKARRQSEDWRVGIISEGSRI